MIASCPEEKLRVWAPDESIDHMARKLNCSSFMASLLWMRGVDVDAALNEREKWITPDLAGWLDGAELGADAKKACDIWAGIKEGDNVVVYGDYDVDGISSTSFMLELALLKGARVRYYIPHRYSQGYGFHPSVVKAIAGKGCKCDLLVVVDCGTQNAEAALEAKSSGIPVLIFDHHLARERIASCDALINPHVDGNELSRDLCAAGVVWCWAWKNEIAPRDWLLKRLDLTALATVADCVPMSSPLNRAIVREGIAAMRRSPREGLCALMRGMDLDPASVDSDSLAMRIIPCLNAAGRLEFADLAMKLFFPKGNVDEQAGKLIDLNRRRRDMSTKIINDVDTGTSSNAHYKHVLFGKDWPAGVLSSVASHVCASRDVPIVLAAPAQPSLIRGTLRVPVGVDAEAILSTLSSDLASWGGHRMAAGFSVEAGKWEEVRDKLEALLSDAKAEDEKEDILYWSPAELDITAWKDAERLGPFGVGNPHPRLFCANKGRINAEPLGRKGNHIRVFVEGRELLGFSGEHLLYSDFSPSGWVYKPRVNFWRCSESLQLVLEKVVVSGS
ncbi:MAG: DHH family phosphoesterase [Synergistaceae bacterium]|nr:DHH family phosphoesterase [Synergistaceae bacterium]